MIDDEIQMAIAIAKEHWLEISGRTKVYLIPEAETHLQDTIEAKSSATTINQRLMEHGDYRFVYLVEHDELFIGRVDEDL